MSSFSNDRLNNYLAYPTRNKIIIHTEPINDIIPLNVGKELAKRLNVIHDDVNLSFIAKQELDILLQTSTFDYHNFGKALSIANLGILFEPGLKIDFRYILDKYSTENILFIHWNGKMDQNDLYFLSEEGIKINIDNLSCIKL